MKSAGVRYTTEIYITSDQLDLTSCITVRSSVPLTPVRPDLSLPELLAALKFDGTGVLRSAPDWRLASDAEISEFQSSDSDDDDF